MSDFIVLNIESLIMKKDNRHIKNIEQIIDTDLIPKDYEVSSDFVKLVMDKVETSVVNRPYLKPLMAVAASIALIIFFGNLFFVVNQLNESTQSQIMVEWTEKYETSNESLWSDYYDIELLASSDKFE